MIQPATGAPDHVCQDGTQPFAREFAVPTKEKRKVGACKSLERSLRSACTQWCAVVRRHSMRIAVVLGLLFAMSDSAAQQTEIDAAVAAPAPVERVRRLEQLVGSMRVVAESLTG